MTRQRINSRANGAPASVIRRYISPPRWSASSGPRWTTSFCTAWLPALRCSLSRLSAGGEPPTAGLAAEVRSPALSTCLRIVAPKPQLRRWCGVDPRNRLVRGDVEERCAIRGVARFPGIAAPSAVLDEEHGDSGVPRRDPNAAGGIPGRVQRQPVGPRDGGRESAATIGISDDKTAQPRVVGPRFEGEPMTPVRRWNPILHHSAQHRRRASQDTMPERSGTGATVLAPPKPQGRATGRCSRPIARELLVHEMTVIPTS